MKKEWKAGFPCFAQAAKRIAEIRKAGDEALRDSDYPLPHHMLALMTEVHAIRNSKISSISPHNDEFD